MAKKLLKAGKVVVVLRGRYAGRKAVIVKAIDEPSKGASRKFANCIIAGIERPPRKVTRAMGVKKVKARSSIKPFLRFVNSNHILPTRYQYGVELSKVKLQEEGKAGETLDVDEKTLKDAKTRGAARKGLKAVFQESFDKIDELKEGKDKQGAHFLFTKLRF